MDVFAEAFHLPTEGMVSFSELSAKEVEEMKALFSSTGVPFRPPKKKKDMKVEYRLLHDIVAKSLCAKAGSFDVVTTKKLEMMVAISAGLKVNWGHIVFQTLVSMVYMPGKLSQGFAVSLSIMLEKRVKADLGESVALHPLKVLNHKSVLTYMKKIQAAQTGPAKSKSGTSSDEDTRPLAKLGVAKKGGPGAKCKLVLASSDSESIVSLPLLDIKKKQRTKRTKPVKPTEVVEAQASSKELPIGVRIGPKQPAQQSMTYGGGIVFAPIDIREINWATHFLPKIDLDTKGKKILEAFAWPSPVEEHCLLVIQAAWEAVSSKMSEYDEWARFRTEVRLNKIKWMTPITSLAKIEDEFMPWAETELVSELLKRRMLVQCKLYEMELKKKVDEHRANFDPANPYANYDHMCIRFLDREIKEMIKQYRAQRHIAGLPLLVPEFSVTGWFKDDIPNLPGLRGA
ncbi:hypothetical protein F511_21613 [Dorcoceras hygrometricum]|uniref:Uncharacterized protein n=1 Tax=Dorcoceras hygrometricum TaxID=472368 RepID=A0A2Z7BUT1_9LAMI|nr:hypothetical protein F511_21613 [Dorcoceras hygrometricum]